MKPRMRYGAHLQPLRDIDSRKQLTESTEQAFYRALDIGDVVAFVGAGMSCDFGLPLWEALAKDVVEAVQNKWAEELDLNEVERSYLKGITSDWTDGSTSNLLAVLDYCHRLYFRRGKQETFGKIVADVLTKNAKSCEGPPIRAAIKNLAIRRAVTTNYDHFIQGELGQSPTVLDRRKASMAKLTSFALGLDSRQAGILYLHGSLDAKGGTGGGLVLTEVQYQRQYTSDYVRARATRDALRLLFYSNSVLFLGCSMEDDDVLRPFRQFISDNDIVVRNRPWFALIDIKESEFDQNHHLEIFHRLYYRYGIRAIFAVRKDVGEIGPAVTRKIEELREGWLEYRRARDVLPKVRLPIIPTKTLSENQRVAIHHATEYAGDLDTARLKDPVPYDELRARSAPSGQLVNHYTFFLIDESGRGKGSAGYWIAHLQREHRRVIGFFATTVFTNDFHSIIEGAYNHLLDSAKKLKAPIELTPDANGISLVEKFFNALAAVKVDCIFVFGGIDRLLRPIPYDPNSNARSSSVADHNGIGAIMRTGRSVNAEYAEFLRLAIRFPKREPTQPSLFKNVVLTSSMFPEAGDLGVDKSEIRYTKLVLRDLVPPRNFTGELHRLATQHLFLNDVLQQSRTLLGNGQWQAWSDEVELEIGKGNQRERTGRMVRSLASELAQNGDRGWMLLVPILQTLSLFTTPVPADVLLTAVKAFISRDDRAPKLPPQWSSSDDEAEAAVKNFEEFVENVRKHTRLIMKVERLGHPPPPRSRFTTHTVVRSAILDSLGRRLMRPAEIHQFDLSDFASEPPDVQPFTIDATNRIFQVFDALAHRGEDLMPEEVDGSDKEDLDCIRGRREYIRGAYGILRSGWSATALCRLLTNVEPSGPPKPLYQQYHRRLTRLLNLVRAHSGDVNVHQDSHDSGDFDVRQYSSEGAALYADELAWLLNELGLVCYCQGALQDSRQFFELCAQIVRKIEGKRPGHRTIQLSINLATVLIDRARLSQARDLLVQAASLSKIHKARESLARAEGYIGLVAHLMGDHKTADDLYKKSIKTLVKMESWRAVSLFRRHRADLLRARADLQGARREIEDATAAAEMGFHPDLLHFCVVSEANLRRGEERADPSRRISVAELEASIVFAKSIGSAKLESDIYRVKALIELDKQDFESANQSALDCLSLSKAYHLRLRMIGCMEMLAILMKERGDTDDAVQTFEETLRRARRFEYQPVFDRVWRTLGQMGFSTGTDHRSSRSSS